MPASRKKLKKNNLSEEGLSNNGEDNNNAEESKVDISIDKSSISIMDSSIKGKNINPRAYTSTGFYSNSPIKKQHKPLAKILNPIMNRSSFLNPKVS